MTVLIISTFPNNNTPAHMRALNRAEYRQTGTQTHSSTIKDHTATKIWASYLECKQQKLIAEPEDTLSTINSPGHELTLQFSRPRIPTNESAVLTFTYVAQMWRKKITIQAICKSCTESGILLASQHYDIKHRISVVFFGWRNRKSQRRTPFMLLSCNLSPLSPISMHHLQALAIWSFARDLKKIPSLRLSSYKWKFGEKIMRKTPHGDFIHMKYLSIKIHAAITTALHFQLHLSYAGSRERFVKQLDSEHDLRKKGNLELETYTKIQRGALRMVTFINWALKR